MGTFQLENYKQEDNQHINKHTQKQGQEKGTRGKELKQQENKNKDNTTKTKRKAPTCFFFLGSSIFFDSFFIIRS